MARRSVLVGGLALATSGSASRSLARAGSAQPEVWTFDRLAAIGGHAVTVEGQPQLTDSPFGRAVRFDGVDDALFIDNHPLAGAEHFTFEALFRPDGGAHEQRWFHLQETPPATGAEQWPGTRFLFEIRVYDRQWCLDAFTKGPGYNQVLIFPDKLHPVGEWAHVAQTYDGATYRSFVNGVLQGEAPLAFRPQGAGATSVGCRFNRVNHFNGAVRAAAFSRRALAPSAFSLLK
ncbi:LamG-like jellyroll fold domain-containing protein [Brevundimonas sp.]|uniref:LamG-like jellyroll fold domain-containing protein n=1 Tax=Brevundimonas sp. TaxID=1871086 RepID=UPI003D6D9C67